MAIVQKSSTGAGTNVIAGLATGMISTFPTVLLFAAAIWTSYALAILWSSISRFSYDGDYRNAISDRCFGPISDNAGGIAEMSELPKKCAHVLISDSVGIRLQQLEKVLLSLQQH
jgi:K(+)-stimulated pyrophosphate-energized sodium pump